MRGYSAVGLVNAKNNINVGATLRAAGCFRSSFVAIQGARYKKAPTDTHCTHRRMPLLQVPDLRDVVPYDCVPVGVELAPDAQALPEYRHPKRAMYIFGPEDGSLPIGVREWCRDVVFIPGGCLNLAATVNVVLYDRLQKRGR